MYASQKDENSSIELPVKFCIEIKRFMENITTLKFSSLFTGMFFSRPVTAAGSAGARALLIESRVRHAAPGRVAASGRVQWRCDRWPPVRRYLRPEIRQWVGAQLQRPRPEGQKRDRCESGDVAPACKRGARERNDEPGRSPSASTLGSGRGPRNKVIH